MSRQCWANPSPSGGKYTLVGGAGGASRLYFDRIMVDRAVAPTTSPAPAPGQPGNLAGVVPQGWVKQIGSDGEVDTMQADTRSGSLVYDANITQFVVPYFSGGWPPDPQLGQPGHTPQRPTGAG